MPIRVMLVDTHPERRELLALGLQAEGCELIAALSPEDDLLAAVSSFAPDVVLIDLDAPNRDALEGLRRVQAREPRPMVLFTQDDAGESIRRAVQAGVNAYIVDGIAARRVRPIVDAAMAQFKQFRALEQELAQARTQLAERKLIERAKGLVMQQRGVGEAEAFQAMRRLAMRKNMRLVQIAEGVIAAAELMES